MEAVLSCQPNTVDMEKERERILEEAKMKFRSYILMIKIRKEIITLNASGYTILSAMPALLIYPDALHSTV